MVKGDKTDQTGSPGDETGKLLISTKRMTESLNALVGQVQRSGIQFVVTFGSVSAFNYRCNMVIDNSAAKGIVTMEDLAEQAVDELLGFPGIDEERAGKLIMKAREPWFADDQGEG